MKHLTHKEREALNAQGHKHGYGGCYRCGDRWSWKRPHDTPYTEWSSCFPLCSECWDELRTPIARLPLYRKMWIHWLELLAEELEKGIGSKQALADTIDKWSHIEAAVMEGDYERHPEG